MKKSSVILTAVCLLAIIGGALAFKAKTNSFFGTLYCSISATTSCTIPVTATLTTAPYVSGYCTTALGGMCTVQTYVIN